MKKWYFSKTIKLALLQGALGIVVALGTQLSNVGWLMVAKSILDILIRIVTEEPISI